MSFGSAKWCVVGNLKCGASRNRTTDTWIFSTMLYTVYQALTGISDQIETISVSQFVPVCPVMPIWLLEQQHLPGLDEITCLELVEVDAGGHILGSPCILFRNIESVIIFV